MPIAVALPFRTDYVARIKLPSRARVTGRGAGERWGNNCHVLRQFTANGLLGFVHMGII